MSAPTPLINDTIAPSPDDTVAELQGLYGPFTFPEKLLQKIWLRGEFDHRHLATTDGVPITVLHPGRWNLLGGPDFVGARLRFGEAAPITGDIELHLHASAWNAHGHAADPAYANVILHVVLFPPRPDCVTPDHAGRPLPIVALLPLLHHDLEAYAADDAIERLSTRPASVALDALGGLPPAELADLLRTHARRRWGQKLQTSRLRLERLGWTDACHHTALEILGYAANRAPMLRIAARWPLAAWARDGHALAEEAWLVERPAWHHQGLRPANHPRVRLRQYAAWAAAVPDWPERVAADATPWPAAATARFPDGERALALPSAEFRAAVGGARLGETWRLAWTGGHLGGTRWQTLLGDGLWPLLAARAPGDGWEARWFHGAPGDQPDALAATLRHLGLTGIRQHPANHGWGQGLLDWLRTHPGAPISLPGA